jgi:predicted MFS family arabinose efflux permease
MNTRVESVRYLRSLFMSNGCVAIAYGILSPALVANLMHRHTSAFLAAAITTIWALPNLLAGPLCTRLIARFNSKACLLGGAAAAVTTLLLFPVFQDVRVWIVLQLVSGAVIGYFVGVTEGWLNHMSSEDPRPGVTAICGILPALGYAIGVGIYTLTGFQGFLPFVASATAMAIGLLPLILLRGTAGDVIVRGESRLQSTARAVPQLLAIALIAGMLETVPWGVYQIFAFSTGFSTQMAAWMLPAFFVGQLVLTYPISLAAERIGPRVLLTVMGGLSVTLMAVMYMWTRSPAVWVIVFLTGGVFNAVYILGLVLLEERFESKALVSASASFMTAYSIGAIAGPPVAGIVMDCFGPQSLPVVLGIVSTIVVAAAMSARLEWRTDMGALERQLASRQGALESLTSTSRTSSQRVPDCQATAVAR